MDARIPHLDKLLELLAEKTNQSVDVKGLKVMSEEIGLTEKYLYEYIYRKKEKARKEGKSTISVQSSKLDTIAESLHFKSYKAFTDSIDKLIDPILLSLIGNYYSYVRRNDELGFILRSPVRIYDHEGKIVFELKGPMLTYIGEAKLRHGCLFVLMESESGKMIHHVYKIGTRLKPEVLKGIFSGVSTNFDPIGGRTILLGVNDEFKVLTNKEETIKNLAQAEKIQEQKIATYLKEFHSNNLQIGRVNTFRYSDLE